jgi:hypothetical protein
VTTRERTAYDWHPIFQFTAEDVWRTLGVTQAQLKTMRDRVRAIRATGIALEQAIAEVGWPWHPAYALGNERLSCSLCVLASRNDLLNGIEFHPDYYRQLVQLEIDSGFAFRQGLWLGDLRPDLLTELQRERLEQVRVANTLPKPSLPVVPPATQLRLEACFT